MSRGACTVDLATPEAVLAIGAHPDDIEFGCGATLARWAAAGAVVHLAVLTDGSKGAWDPHADLGALVRTRQREQHAAAAALGATGEVVFLGEPDGELESTMGIRAAVAEVVRRVRPQLVLGHDPWRRYRLHPDHRHAGWLTVDGVVAARDPHFFPDRGPHHRPATLLLYEADETNHVETATDAAAEAKVAALLAHRSQLESTMGIGAGDDGTQRAAFEQSVLDRLADDGSLVGATLGEAFHRLTL